MRRMPARGGEKRRWARKACALAHSEKRGRKKKWSSAARRPTTNQSSRLSSSTSSPLSSPSASAKMVMRGNDCGGRDAHGRRAHANAMMLAGHPRQSISMAERAERSSSSSVTSCGKRFSIDCLLSKPEDTASESSPAFPLRPTPRLMTSATHTAAALPPQPPPASSPDSIASAAAAAVQHQHLLYSQWLATRNSSIFFGLQGEKRSIHSRGD